MITIEKGCVVNLRYLMKDDQGTVLENRMDAAPVEFLYGSGKILPELEEKLAGMTTGDKASFSFEIDCGVASMSSLHFDLEIESVRTATDTEVKEGRVKPAEDEICGPGCNC